MKTIFSSAVMTDEVRFFNFRYKQDLRCGLRAENRLFESGIDPVSITQTVQETMLVTNLGSQAGIGGKIDIQTGQLIKTDDSIVRRDAKTLAQSFAEG
ncbi:hypothetical protein GEOBC_00486 [Geobacteraceae bacterium]|nr:hypothetical protein GEOBC_00486 [Geobacteraceae bacterium]